MYHTARLGEVLISQRILTPEQVQQAEAIALSEGDDLAETLVRHGFVSDERMLQVQAMMRGVSSWYGNREDPDPAAVSLLSEEVCRRLWVLPLQVQGDRLLVAMLDTDDVVTIDQCRQFSGYRIEPVLTRPRVLERCMDRVFAGLGHRAVDQLVTQAMGEVSDDWEDVLPAESGVSKEEMRPVVGLVQQILGEAVRLGASDIHFEPRRYRTEIRFRIDGRLHVMREVPAALHRALTARVKIMANLDIVEYRVPQDGRISLNHDGRSVDIRVSVLPNVHGSRIVLRLLDKSVALRNLDELGFSPRNLALFGDMITKPYGLILVTGPTGSGKTTTLYSALNHIKDSATNIMTCEDPVEYDIEGINQSHVNEKVGLTFAAQLRAILRQDPDVILVGEIRDKETADTAIRAALTGHLVLSTLHCNDAAGAVPRLTDMGVEPFMLSSALIGVMAQRLVRLLCPHCRTAVPANAAEQRLMIRNGVENYHWVYEPVGCPECAQIGYHGRTSVHEVMPFNAEMQRLVARRESSECLREAAAKFGFRTLQADALDRVAAAWTSMAEVRRQVFYDTVGEQEASEPQHVYSGEAAPTSSYAAGPEASLRFEAEPSRHSASIHLGRHNDWGYAVPSADAA